MKEHHTDWYMCMSSKLYGGFLKYRWMEFPSAESDAVIEMLAVGEEPVGFMKIIKPPQTLTNRY